MKDDLSFFTCDSPFFEILNLERWMGFGSVFSNKRRGPRPRAGEGGGVTEARVFKRGREGPEVDEGDR